MSDIEHYMTRCSELSREVVRLESQRRLLSDKNDELQARVVELEKQLEREYIRTRHARAQTEVRDEEIESLKGALHDYERMVVASEARIATLKASLAEKTAECEVLIAATGITEDSPEFKLQILNNPVVYCAYKIGYAKAMIFKGDEQKDFIANIEHQRDTAIADLTTAREECERLRGEKPDDKQDICGLCGEPGADKMAKWTGGGVYWPQENKPDTELVHEACEDEECRRASDLCQGRERESFLRNI